jgi:hypothetical protein
MVSWTAEFGSETSMSAPKTASMTTFVATASASTAKSPTLFVIIHKILIILLLDYRKTDTTLYHR